MTAFDARLRLIGETGLPLGVEVGLTGERMTLNTTDGRLADWPLDDISVSRQPDGFHIKAEGEEIVLNVTDPNMFAFELGVVDHIA